MKKLLTLFTLLAFLSTPLYAADTPLSELDPIGGALSADDLLYIVDDPAGTPVSKSTTVGDVRATLAANGANCAAGQAPLGVDAAGAVESCFDVGTQVELDAHISDGSAAHAASAISVSSATLEGTGTDVQAVFEELDNGIADHLADAAGAHAASAISFTPAGNLVATDVQAALEELDTDKLSAVDETAGYDWTGQHTFTETIGSATSAGAFGAGVCTEDGFHGIDTTNDIAYFCSDGDGGNARSFGSLGDGYTQFSDGTLSSSASGIETFKFEDTAEIDFTVTAGDTDKLTASIIASSIATTKLANHVKSIYFPANALTTDGTQCANPALVTINSGPRIYTIICADNDGSTVHGHVVMPDSWNAGTVTFELEYLQTAADTSAMNSDIAAMCRGAGETVNSTYGTEIAIDDAAVSGSNIVDHTTSAAVTANGTCAAGDTLFFRWQLDATGTTTAVATLHILGVKMEYTVTGGGSD
jgi:hypothetical protein